MHGLCANTTLLIGVNRDFCICRTGVCRGVEPISHEYQGILSTSIDSSEVCRVSRRKMEIEGRNKGAQMEIKGFGLDFFRMLTKGA